MDYIFIGGGAGGSGCGSYGLGFDGSYGLSAGCWSIFWVGNYWCFYTGFYSVVYLNGCCIGLNS